MPPVAPLQSASTSASRCVPPWSRSVMSWRPAPSSRRRNSAGSAEAQGGMRLRQLGRRRGADLGDGLADQSLDALPVHSVPPREGDAAAGFERAQALGHGGLGVGKMADAEGAGRLRPGCRRAAAGGRPRRPGSRCRDACAAQPPACRSRGPRRRPARPVSRPPRRAPQSRWRRRAACCPVPHAPLRAAAQWPAPSPARRTRHSPRPERRGAGARRHATSPHRRATASLPFGPSRSFCNVAAVIACHLHRLKGAGRLRRTLCRTRARIRRKRPGARPRRRGAGSRCQRASPPCGGRNRIMRPPGEAGISSMPVHACGTSRGSSPAALCRTDVLQRDGSDGKVVLRIGQ